MAISVHPKIWHEYEEKRRQAESDAAFRRIEVYRKIPRIREIDQALEQTGINAVRTYLQSPGKSKEELLRELKETNYHLREEKKALLKQAGISENYADPIYQCPCCQDTGFSDGKQLYRVGVLAYSCGYYAGTHVSCQTGKGSSLRFSGYSGLGSGGGSGLRPGVLSLRSLDSGYCNQIRL